MSDVHSFEKVEHKNRYIAATAAFANSSAWSCYYLYEGEWYKGQIKQQGWPPDFEMVFEKLKSGDERGWVVPIGDSDAFINAIKDDQIKDSISYEVNNKDLSNIARMIVLFCVCETMMFLTCGAEQTQEKCWKTAQEPKQHGKEASGHRNDGKNASG